jgi:acyl-CoA thioesterase-1
MRRTGTRLVAILAMTLVSGCGGGGGGSTPPPLVTPGTWVVLGSSTAAGVGASAGQGWVDRLAAQVLPRAVTLENLARSGAVTYEALPTGSMPPPDRPAPDPLLNIDRALSFAPKLVILSFPTNDTAAGYSRNETLDNLRLLRERARTAGVAVMLLSTQPRDAFDGTQRAQLAAIDLDAAALFGTCFIALREALSDGAGQIAAAYSAGDGIHLNDAGHQLVYERVLARLEAGQCVRIAAT